MSFFFDFAQIDTNMARRLIERIIDMKTLDLSNSTVLEEQIHWLTQALGDEKSLWSYMLGLLIGTSTYSSEDGVSRPLEKRTYFLHDAWTPKEVGVLVFHVIGESVGFLINIAKNRDEPLHDIPFDQYGEKPPRTVATLPIPPVEYLDLETLIRINIDTSDDKFECSIAYYESLTQEPRGDGRFCSIPSTSVENILTSFYRREDGFKLTDSLTFYQEYNDDLSELSDSDEENDRREEDRLTTDNYNREIERRNTFENLVLDMIYKTQHNIGSVSYLESFIRGILAEDFGIVKTEEQYTSLMFRHTPPESELETVFLIGLEHASEPSLDLLKEQLNQFVLEISEANVAPDEPSVLMKLAFIYNVDCSGDFDSIDNIASIQTTIQKSSENHALTE